ncbi:carbon-nitrogen hydrolase [Mariannaea sp. PMI_226]|nr:carbon-nitrogen hydrolase [Mariannaea sp. PMI_226]
MGAYASLYHNSWGFSCTPRCSCSSLEAFHFLFQNVCWVGGPFLFSTTMRVGCLQFAPQVGDVDNNLNRADAILSRANPNDLDLIVLPELAFSGYNFKSLREIYPFLELSDSGITSLWARTVALRYDCVVIAGYPEKADISRKWPTGPEYYNSAILVNEDGEIIANCRKSSLFRTDETWALEGNGGFCDAFVPRLGNVSMGICMDISPDNFEKTQNEPSFASHVLQVNSNLVVISMAWMTKDDPCVFSRLPNEPDMESLTHWITHLESLIRSENRDEIIVVFCNRTGHENGATYAGTSAVIGVQDGEVNVYSLLGRGEKDLLVVDTDDVPYAKLVYRPEDHQVPATPRELQKNTRHESEKNPGERDEKPRKSSDIDTSNVELSLHEPVNSASIPTPSSPLPLIPTNGGVKNSTRKGSRGAASIPRELDLAKGKVPQLPELEHLDIPTPSAPSPIPMALRPRLIIPESPPMLRYHVPSDDPTSAMSFRSVRSVTSNQSEASVQTIRSNPRTPGDSAPFPHTGIPQSWYPSKSFAESDMKGGPVRMMSAYPAFSLDIPADELSPVSMRDLWRPISSVIATPQSGVDRDSKTSILGLINTSPSLPNA